MAPGRGRVPFAVLALLSLSVSAVVHLRYAPEHLPVDPLAALPSLLVGWVAFALAFYALGRLRGSTRGVTASRTADLGVGLVGFTLLLAGAISAFGFTMELVPEVYVALAAGLYAGLALVGWSIGRRTSAINRLAAER